MDLTGPRRQPLAILTPQVTREFRYTGQDEQTSKHHRWNVLTSRCSGLPAASFLRTVSYQTTVGGHTPYFYPPSDISAKNWMQFSVFLVRLVFTGHADHHFSCMNFSATMASHIPIHSVILPFFRPTFIGYHQLPSNKNYHFTELLMNKSNDFN